MVVLLAACASGGADDPTAVRLPPAGAGFDYQLGGDGSLPAGVTVVARDWQAGSPVGGEVYDICYVNAFQSQPDVQWPPEVVTTAEDPDWPGEFVIDLSSAQTREVAAARVGEMIEHCAQRGFDAVEFDNLDTFVRFGDLGSGEVGFGRAETAAYASLLVEMAHANGLAAGQKNTVELLGEPLGFDFAVVEKCGEYAECDAFREAYGERVYAIEYTAEGLAAACAALGEDASVILRDLDLVPAGAPGYVYATCRSALGAG